MQKQEMRSACLLLFIAKAPADRGRDVVRRKWTYSNFFNKFLRTSQKRKRLACINMRKAQIDGKTIA